MAQNTSRLLFEQMHEFTNLLRRQHHKMHREQMQQAFEQRPEGQGWGRGPGCGHGHGPHGRPEDGFGGRGQGRTLDILAQNGEMTQKELAEALRIRPSSVSELISKLEMKGYVKRTINEEDKRSFSISLAPEGEKAAQEAAEQMNSRLEPLFAPLTDEEQEQLSTLMGKLIAGMDDGADDEADAFFEGGPHGGFGWGGPHKGHHKHGCEGHHHHEGHHHGEHGEHKCCHGEKHEGHECKGKHHHGHHHHD